MNPIRFFYTTILFFSFSFLVAQAPSNNTYQTATTLIVQSGSCSTQTEGDFTHATASGISPIPGSCLLNDRNDSPLDVWFKATFPSSGKLTIQTSAVSGSVLNYTRLFVYTLIDGTLTISYCVNSSGFSKLELTEQTENTVIYFRVAEGENLYGYYTNRLGPFNICAYDPDGTLDFPQTPKPLLSYYSNPVGNRLSVESPYQIETLRVFDLMGKEVLHKTPQQQKLTLDTYTLAPGAYLLRVETPEGEQTVKLVKK